jgi:hypothetical protein
MGPGQQVVIPFSVLTDPAGGDHHGSWAFAEGSLK